jgi:spore photoproduct lyase
MEKERKNLLFGEFIRGEDGKFRYIKAERIKVYTMLYNQLKSRQNDLFVYLCMERADVWKTVTGITLDESEGLIALFDKRIHDFYGGIA